MTALHAYAQTLLNERKSLTIPPVEAEVGGRKRRKSASRTFEFDSARLEMKTDDIVPDVVLAKDGRELLVEFVVTHRCDATKLSRIESIGLSAIEIDLSEFPRRGTLGEFAEAILHAAPRVWLFNRHHSGLKAVLEKELENERLEDERRKLQATARRRENYARDLQSALAALPSELTTKRWHSVELEAAISVSTGGEGFFSVHPTCWKYVLVDLLEQGLHPSLATKHLIERGWIRQQWTASKSSDRLNAAAGLPTGPADAAEMFLRSLRAKGIAQNDGVFWKFAPGYLNKILARERQVLAEKHARIECAKRIAKLDQLTTIIIELAKASNGFDRDAWKGASTEFGSPLALAEEGRTGWFKLSNSLEHLVQVLEGRKPPPADPLRLPVAARLAELREAHEARLREDQDRAATLAEEAREHRLRVVQLEIDSYGSTSPNWLDSSNARLNGDTPRNAAAASEDGLHRVLKLLLAAAQAAREKSDWEKKLLDTLERELGSEEQAKLFGSTHGHRLPGDDYPNRVCPLARNARSHSQPSEARRP